MRTLEVWYGVFSPQILALVSKDTDVLSDEAFAADHQTIHKVSHTLAVDARDLESSNSLLLYDPLRNSRLPGLGGHTAAIIQQTTVFYQSTFLCLLHPRAAFPSL